MKPNLDTAIEVLKKEGVSDREIQGHLEALTEFLSQELYVLLVDQLSEEDMERLDRLPSDAREQAMKDIFLQKTGKAFEAVSNEFVQNYVTNFLATYKEAKAQPA